MWKRLAIRYGKYSEMLAFELLNEIVEPEVAEAWNGIALQAIDVIREITKDTWIIFGGTMYNYLWRNNVQQCCKCAAYGYSETGQSCIYVP